MVDYYYSFFSYGVLVHKACWSGHPSAVIIYNKLSETPKGCDIWHYFWNYTHLFIKWLFSPTKTAHGPQFSLQLSTMSSIALEVILHKANRLKTNFDTFDDPYLVHLNYSTVILIFSHFLIIWSIKISTASIQNMSTQANNLTQRWQKVPKQAISVYLPRTDHFTAIYKLFTSYSR